MSNVNQTPNAATQYREVSRKANAGERIKIVNAGYAGSPPAYANGDIVTVIERDNDRSLYIDRKWDGGQSYALVYDKEYVVLEPIAPAAPSLPDLFAQFIRDNAPAVRSYLAEIEPVDNAEPVTEVNEVTTQAAPLTRAKVIEMARERVAELERIGRGRGVALEGSVRFRTTYYAIDFVINREKRVVTALVFRLNGADGTYERAERKPAAVGIAKAAPDDVFNADIGKAIAVERALGLTLTDAFVNAPKPTEKVAGMIVTFEDRVRKLAPAGAKLTGGVAHVGSLVGKRGTIIDDTDADYTQQGGEAA